MNEVVSHSLRFGDKMYLGSMQLSIEADCTPVESVCINGIWFSHGQIIRLKGQLLIDHLKNKNVYLIDADQLHPALIKYLSKVAK